MVNKKLFLILSLLIIIFVGGFFTYNYFENDVDTFTKTSLIKLNIPVGGDFESSIKIYNPEKFSQNFKVYLNDFKNLVSLSEDEFSLLSKDQKEIDISFKDLKKVPNVYAGKFIIEGEFYKEVVPIVVGVEDPNSAFAIIVSSIPKYDEVNIDGKLGVDIKVYDLIGANAQTVYAEYEIRNLDGDVLKTGNSNLIVGSGSKSELFDIPSDWEEGDYVLITSIKYKDTVSLSSYIFNISRKQDGVLFGNIGIFVVLFVFVLGIFALVFYFVKTRDLLLVELKNQQNKELKRHIKYIERSKVDVSKSKEKRENKKKKVEALDKIKKEVIKQIKHKQESQKKEISKLSKHKDKSVAKKKLSEWKNQGYKMYDTEKAVKKITQKGISEKVKEWDTQGYDTSFLNR